MNDGKVTVITGTSRGIGKYLAQHYLDKGHQVVGCSRSQVDEFPGNYEHFCLDVSDEASVRRMFAEIRKRYGRLDVLVNNAGVASMNHMLLTPAATVHDILNTNVVGAFLCCREAAKVMQKNRYGRIVNFATVATPLKLEGEAVYAASKAAVITLTHVLARELADFGITVNAIGPTPIETDLIRAIPKEKIDDLVGHQAIKRLGEFTDVANVIDFFIQPESDFISGQVLFLGGV